MELRVKKFGEREELKQLHPRKGYKTLGVFIAHDGYHTYQLREITKKATSWADKIQRGHLPAQEACKCLSLTTIKKLDYPLPALTL